MMNDKFEKEDNELENKDIFDDLVEDDEDTDEDLTKIRDLEDSVLNQIDDPVRDESDIDY